MRELLPKPIFETRSISLYRIYEQTKEFSSNANAQSSMYEEANKAELIVCNLENDFVYVETFVRFKTSQIEVFSKLGINDDGVTGRAKAK